MTILNACIFIFSLPALALILRGVKYEDKLVQIEHGVAAGVRQTVKEWRAEHDKV